MNAHNPDGPAAGQTILFVSMASGDALRAARRLGARVILVSESELAWQRDLVDLRVTAAPYDPGSVIGVLGRCDGLGSVDAVVTFDERAVPAAAAVAAAFGVVGNDVASAYAARNKFAMRNRFDASGLPCPRYALVQSAAEAVDAAASIGFPVVLKPLFGFASQGVLRLDTAAGLVAAFPRVRRVADTHLPFVGADPYADCLLVEEYLPGREVAVDGLVAEDGSMRWWGLFDKPYPLDGPTFEEILYVTPSEEPANMQADLLHAVEAGVRALGLSTGPIHAEVRLTPAGPRIIEIGARAIGGVCARAHSYAIGLDYNEAVLRAALRLPVLQPRRRPVPSGVMMLPVPGAGRLVRVDGVASARAAPGIQDVLVLAKPGDIILGPLEQTCYLGFILASGPSTRDVRERLAQAHARLHFEVAPLAEDTATPA